MLNCKIATLPGGQGYVVLIVYVFLLSDNQEDDNPESLNKTLATADKLYEEGMFCIYCYKAGVDLQ